MSATHLEADVVVVGAGMAGLVSAAKATEYTDEVIVLEKSHRPGGSMYISFGSLHTFGTMKEVEETVPHGNRGLQQLVVESYDEGVAWLEGHDIPVKERQRQAGTAGPARLIEPAETTERLVEIIEGRGGEIHLETPMEALRLDDDGRVVGVVANGPDHRVVVEADSVIIATGGFQGNEQLVQQFITNHPENLVLRSNPWSTGDGLLAALEVGAKTTVGMDTFYGHNLIAPPAQYSPLEFVEATQYYGPFGIAVDSDGERFTDESEAPFEFTLAQDTAVIADGRAFLIIDSDIYDSHTPTEMHIGSIVERARDYGGPVAEVDDLDGIREVLTDWGSNGFRAVRTIEGYNEALREGTVDELTPPRRDNHLVIDTPPYYVVEVRPGITFTMGGLDVNENGEVLRRTGTSSMLDQPVEDVRDVLTDSIEGLYAAGADVGNIHHRHYLGGLTVALITGLEVGENAAKHSQHHAD